MKMEKTVLANTFAVTTAFVWTICTLGVALFPKLAFQVKLWLTHGLVVSPMGDWNITFTSFLMGGLVLVSYAWITGYVFGLVWEFMSKR